LTKRIAVGCPGVTLAALDACGSTPAALTGCLTCGGWREAIQATRSVYGAQ
jgi:hypothetical protein